MFNVMKETQVNVLAQIPQVQLSFVLNSQSALREHLYGEKSRFCYWVPHAVLGCVFLLAEQRVWGRPGAVVAQSTECFTKLCVFSGRSYVSTRAAEAQNDSLYNVYLLCTL